jgi:radical SAM protein with 4Fe4S-binding SPASM domain
MDKPILWAIGLELTNNCNLKCPMCWSQNPKLYLERPRGYMTWQLFTKTVDELAEYRAISKRNMKVCMNYGGESMLHPRYSDMIRYAAKKNCFELRAITNATLLTSEVSRVLVDCNVHVTISIHNTAQLRDVYQKVGYLKKIRGLKLEPRLDGSILASEFEKKELMQQLKRWNKLLDSVAVYAEITEDLKFNDNVWYVNLRKPKPAVCRQPSYYMGILWNGDVYPCCHLLSTNFKGMGNVARTSVTEVWGGEKYRLLRQGQLPDSPCLSCELFTLGMKN